MDGRNKLHHRKVAEQLLGRPLTNLEIVHHSNEIRSDYRPINLWVFPDRSSHTRLHKTGTIHAETIFLGACWVVSFGPPWNTPWLEAKNASHPLDGGPRS
jgi:hypothetical protein